MTPTANFIAFSGTRASGARIRNPATTTSIEAASAAIAASEMSRWALPKVSAIKTTSKPSSVTPLNASVNAYQSRTRPRWSGAPAALAGAQDRFAQPLQAEYQQQPADDQPQAVEG